jgi:hypothetical protein
MSDLVFGDLCLGGGAFERVLGDGEKKFRLTRGRFWKIWFLACDSKEESKRMTVSTTRQARQLSNTRILGVLQSLSACDRDGPGNQVQTARREHGK